MNIPINRWTIALALTIVAGFMASRVQQRGDFDFGPALAGAAALIAVVALWCGLLLATFL